MGRGPSRQSPRHTYAVSPTHTTLRPLCIGTVLGWAIPATSGTSLQPFEDCERPSRAGAFELIVRASRYIAAAAVALWCPIAPARRLDVPWKIDEPTAERLVAEGWRHGKLPGVLDYDPGMSRRFFEFYGITTSPGSEGGFGYFAVNPWTGDVWALWGCHQLSTPTLRRSQAQIRRRFTHDELKQYPRLARFKPKCVVTD